MAVSDYIRDLISDKDREIGDRYRFLGRHKSDLDYYFGNEGRSHSAKHLWAGEFPEHIENMKAIYNSFDDNEKPEWLTMQDIEDYERRELEFLGERTIGINVQSTDITRAWKYFAIDIRKEDSEQRAIRKELEQDLDGLDLSDAIVVLEDKLDMMTDNGSLLPDVSEKEYSLIAKVKHYFDDRLNELRENSLKEQWQQDIGYSVESHAETLLWKAVESDPDFDYFINREFPGDEYSWNECQNLSIEFIIEAIDYGYGEGDEEDIRHILNKLKPIWGYKAPVMTENKLTEKKNLKQNINDTIIAVFEEENMKLLGSKARKKTFLDHIGDLFSYLDKDYLVFLRSAHEFEDLLVKDLKGIKLDFSKNSIFWKDDTVEASFWIQEPTLYGKTEAELNLFYKKGDTLYSVNRGTVNCDTGLLTLFMQQYKQNKEGKFTFDYSTKGKYEKLTYENLFTQEELGFLRKKYIKLRESGLIDSFLKSR